MSSPPPFFQRHLARHHPPSDLGIYLHLPFCVEKCPYCDFVSGPMARSQQNRYLEVLGREIRDSPFRGTSVRTLFFGGGTPSEVQTDRIVELMSLLGGTFDFSRLQEATIECNPGTLTAPALAAFYRAGFDRLSLGAQSLQDEHLRRLGRVHTAHDTRSAFEMVRRAGFRRVNLDLMFGLVEQTPEQFEQDLQDFVALKPEHLSLYHLTIEKGTDYFSRVGSGELRPADEESSSRMLEHACSTLQEHGFHQYEISNFALRGEECLHNTRYWNNAPTLGFGVSASSYVDGTRWSNTRDLRQYLSSVPGAQVALDCFEQLKPRAALGEEMMLRLRTQQGLDLDSLSDKYGLDADSLFSQQLHDFQQLELIARRGSRLSLTLRGRLVADSVCVEFLEG